MERQSTLSDRKSVDDSLIRLLNFFPLSSWPAQLPLILNPTLASRRLYRDRFDLPVLLRAFRGERLAELLVADDLGSATFVSTRNAGGVVSILSADCLTVSSRIIGFLICAMTVPIFQ